MPVKVYRLYKKRKLTYKLPYVPKLETTREEGKIHAEKVIKIIIDALRLRPKWFWRWLTNWAKIYVADEWYHLVTNEDISEITNICREKLYPKDWVKEVFDCDDFTNVLLGEVSLLRYKARRNLAVGKIWFCSWRHGFCHATIFYINEYEEFIWYEPQLCREAPMYNRYCDKVLLVVI